MTQELLYTSAPLGLFLATYVTFWIQGIAFKGQPEVAWRYVFLTGLIPAAVAFIIRSFVKEPERWVPAAKSKLSDLFSPELRGITLGGLAMAIVALLCWWSNNAFIPTVANGLATRAGESGELWKKAATNYLIRRFLCWSLDCRVVLLSLFACGVSTDCRTSAMAKTCAS